MLSVKIIDMGKQNGSADCALFLLATLTSLCLGIALQTLVFDQNELRPPYVSFLESQNFSSFPTKKKQAIINIP